MPDMKTINRLGMFMNVDKYRKVEIEHEKSMAKIKDFKQIRRDHSRNDTIPGFPTGYSPPAIPTSMPGISGFSTAEPKGWSNVVDTYKTIFYNPIKSTFAPTAEVAQQRRTDASNFFQNIFPKSATIQNIKSPSSVPSAISEITQSPSSTSIPRESFPSYFGNIVTLGQAKPIGNFMDKTFNPTPEVAAQRVAGATELGKGTLNIMTFGQIPGLARSYAANTIGAQSAYDKVNMILNKPGTGIVGDTKGYNPTLQPRYNELNTELNKLNTPAPKAGNWVIDPLTGKNLGMTYPASAYIPELGSKSFPGLPAQRVPSILGLGVSGGGVQTTPVGDNTLTRAPPGSGILQNTRGGFDIILPSTMKTAKPTDGKWPWER